MSKQVLVSACLLGLATRYDGCSKPSPAVIEFVRQNGLLAVPVCPEQLGGLSTPRLPCEFTDGDGSKLLDGCNELRNDAGAIISTNFIHGAGQTLQIAKLTGCTQAIFKERSPSCGVNSVHCCGKIIKGCGVTTALLRRNGIEVYSNEKIISLSALFSK